MKRNALTKSIMMALAGAGAIVASSTASAQYPHADFTFSPNRPRLVVLLHGVTPKKEENPEQMISYPGHIRHYWGYQFIKGLMGQLNEPAMRVVTPRSGTTALRIKENTINDWTTMYPWNASDDMAPVFFPKNAFAIPANMEQNDQFVKEYIKLSTKGGANSTMVMVNTRDGSKHLMPQVEETINEVYASYVRTFNHLPEPSNRRFIWLAIALAGSSPAPSLPTPKEPTSSETS